jgi:hypothetical protein
VQPAGAALQQVTTPHGRLDVVGGVNANPDELPWRVMTSHPVAVDASTGMANGGSVKATKYRTCGHRHGYVRRESALNGTRLNAHAPVCCDRALPDSGKRWPASARANTFRDGRKMA